MMDKKTMDDIVEWDCVNWSRAIAFWDRYLGNIDVHGMKVLDIGGRNGGLSLYWALKGAQVLCTDLREKEFENAKHLHRKYCVDQQVVYRQLDVLELKEVDEYDIVTFKSVMGGVGGGDNFRNQRKMVENIFSAIKPGGYCVCAENLVGSLLHMWLRKKFRPWSDNWRYIDIDEFKQLFNIFCELHIETYGFLGTLGQGRFLDICSMIDTLFDKWMGDSNKYIVSCVARK